MKSYLLRITDEQYDEANRIAGSTGMTLKDVFLSGHFATAPPPTVDRQMRVLREALGRLEGGGEALTQAERTVRDGNWE